MNQKLLTLVIFGISLLGTVCGYYLKEAYKFNICEASTSCIKLMTNGEGLFYGSIALVLISGVLLFLPRAFNIWKKFAIWATPIIALIFVFYEDPYGLDFVSPDSEVLFKWVSGIYVAISLVIIAKATLKNKKES